MIKVLLVAGSESDANVLANKLKILANIAVVDVLLPKDLIGDWLQQYDNDCIIVSNSVASNILTVDARQQVVSKTHHGMQLMDIDNIYYFQADHKYVTAYHATGQLLIEDSLDSLEIEFARSFVRIHRKLLIAKNKVENLHKDASGKYFIKLHKVDSPLMVSRRRVSQVRKALAC